MNKKKSRVPKKLIMYGYAVLSILVFTEITKGQTVKSNISKNLRETAKEIDNSISEIILAIRDLENYEVEIKEIARLPIETAVKKYEKFEETKLKQGIALRSKFNLVISIAKFFGENVEEPKNKSNAIDRIYSLYRFVSERLHNIRSNQCILNNTTSKECKDIVKECKNRYSAINGNLVATVVKSDFSYFQVKIMNSSELDKFLRLNELYNWDSFEYLTSHLMCLGAAQRGLQFDATSPTKNLSTRSNESKFNINIEKEDHDPREVFRTCNSEENYTILQNLEHLEKAFPRFNLDYQIKSVELFKHKCQSKTQIYCSGVRKVRDEFVLDYVTKSCSLRSVTKEDLEEDTYNFKRVGFTRAEIEEHVELIDQLDFCRESIHFNRRWLYINPVSGASCNHDKDGVQTTDSERGTKLASGTGFFISPDGYLLTANHVVNDGKLITVVDGNGVKRIATIVATSAVTDVALLKVDFRPQIWLSISETDRINLGDPVYTLGFPVSDILGKQIKYANGSVTALSTGNADVTQLMVSIAAYPGNSGGPLLSNEGKVLGMVVSKISTSKFIEKTNELPLGMTFAVKSEYLLPLVKRFSSSVKVPSMKIDSVQKATVYIEVEM